MRGMRSVPRSRALWRASLHVGLFAIAVGCAREPSPPPTASPSSAGPACERALVALRGRESARGRRPTDPGAWSALANDLDEERLAVRRAGLEGDLGGALVAYLARAAEAVRLLRGLSENPADASAPLGAFPEAMSAFMERCTAPECGQILFTIGAHTMHQPRLDETLPVLADELSAVHVADPKVQRELEDFVRITRSEAASFKLRLESPARAKASLDALDEARRALRGRCERPR